MNKEIMIFESQEVEVFELNGEVLFNPYHVAVCLDIADSTLREHLSVMNNKQVFKVTNEILSNVGLTNFRKIHNTGENFLTERGVYKLIFKSRKPEAEKFQDWVTDVVLPSIRKTGSYSIDMPKSLPEALRLYANEIEMKELAIKQRDEAIKTKAWISDKKTATATAMATASVVTRENGKLKEQIGDSKTWKQVKAICWLNEFFDLKHPAAYSQIGTQLSKLSKTLGYECKQIPDTAFGFVKAYHIDVINHFKYKLIDDLNMMRKYRLAA